MKNLGINIEIINDLSTSYLAQEVIQNTVNTCAKYFESAKDEINRINDLSKSCISGIEKKVSLAETASKAAELAKHDYSNELIFEESEKIRELALGTAEFHNCISSITEHAGLQNDSLAISSITEHAELFADSLGLSSIIDQINNFESRFQGLEPNLTGILDSINDVEIISDPLFLKTYLANSNTVYEEAIKSAQSIYSGYDSLFESNHDFINKLLGNHLSGLTVDQFIDGLESDKSDHRDSTQKVLKSSLNAFNKFELYALISYLKKRLDNPIKILNIIVDVVGLFQILKFGGLFIVELIFVSSTNCYLPYNTTVSMTDTGNSQRYVIGMGTPVTIITDKRTDKKKVIYKNAWYEEKTGYTESDRDICNKTNEI